VVIAASLVATPFVIRLLGTESYGVLALINVLIGYLAFADLGMGAASTRFGSQAHARGDDEEEASVVWTALALSFIPSMVAALALALAARPLVEHALRLPDHLQGVAVIALRIAAVGFVARAVSGVLNTPQLTRLRMDLYTLINSGSAVLQVALVPTVLALGGGLVAAVSVIAGICVGVVLAHSIVSAKLVPGLIRPRLNAGLIRPFFSFGGALVVSYVASATLMNMEKFLLPRYASVTALAHYSVAYTFASLLAVAPIAIGQSLFPAFSRLQAGADREPLKRLYERVLRGCLICLGPTALIMTVTARPFFTIWAGSEYGRESAFPFYILLVGLIFNVLAYIPSTLLVAFDKHRITARFNLIQLLPYGLFAGVLVYRFGAVGAAAAWSLRLLLDALFLFFMASRVARFSFWPFSGGWRSYPTAIAVLLVPVPLVLSEMASPVILFVIAAVSLSAYGTMIWRYVLTAEERAWVWEQFNWSLRGLVARKA